jgi:Zn-dependent protease
MDAINKEHGDRDPLEGDEPLQAIPEPTQPASLPHGDPDASQEDPERPDEVQVVEEAIAPQDAEVLAELGRLQNQQPPWWRAIALLAISLVLFVGATQTERSGRGWQSLVILLAVLAFHELGHYIAMRCFGYRNLRMFFIPFFGAAVSGRNHNVAGWKKAVVALAGPVPGILIGAPLGVVGVLLREPRVVEVALLLLILNGFNLLPFLPLDGGWVVHAVLFVRHPALDVVFRLAAALCLLGVALLLKAWLLAALAVFMLLALPISWRLAQVAYRLKQQGYVAVSSDADTIPTSTALSILAELRPAFPRQTTPRVMAQNVANVFETLNADPPSLLTSFCLLAVHAFSFALVFVMGIVMILAPTLLRHV